MDFRAYAIELHRKNRLFFLLFSCYSSSALASGDIDTIYISFFLVWAFVVAFIIILRKLKFKIRSIVLFSIVLLIDYKIAFSIPFGDNKSLVLILLSISIVVLFLYIALQIKCQNNRNEDI